MKQQGYLWNYYGFTRLHLWGVHIVSGALAATGAFTFVLALLRLPVRGSAPLVELLLKISAVAFLGCMATVATSVLSLLFFRGAHQMGLLEGKPTDERK